MSDLPDFANMDESELRTTLAELQMEFDISAALLDRALNEVANRKKDKREGVVRMKVQRNDVPHRTH